MTEGLMGVWNVLDGFFKSAGVYTILVLILADVLMGIFAAIRAGEFKWDEVARFYRTTVVPYLGSYIVLMALETYIPSTIMPKVLLGFAVPAYGAMVANLLASIIGSIKKLGLPMPAETTAEYP